jgi:hypothetical protein
VHVSYLAHADKLAIPFGFKNAIIWLERSEPLVRRPTVPPDRRRNDRCAIVPLLGPAQPLRSDQGAMMIPQLVKYLRETAQSCVRLARSCPHLPTSHCLGEIAMDLTAKAKELEDLNLD